jgi:ribosomal protein L36
MSTTDPKADDDQDETTTNTTARETDDLRNDVDPEAGHRGHLVTARCVGCKTVRRKLAPPEIADRDADHPSFRHICHDCQRVRWYNTISILEHRSTEGSDQ